MTSLRVFVLVVVGLACLPVNAAHAADTVTVDTFVRAETDTMMARYVAQGGFGKFLHIRGMTPVDKQNVIRMNRDTLYSAGVFDLTTPVTIVKPDHGKRYQSMQVINQDHSTLMVEQAAGTFTLTREKVGTRYAIVLLRTFADPNDPVDMREAMALQDRVQVQQAAAGSFEVPQWDGTSLETVRSAVNVLAATKSDTSGFFGDKAKLNPIDHLLGTAYGWGGLPRYAAVYQAGMPQLNDGKTPYALTVREAPVDGFWSITVYNAKGFMEPDALDRYSVNNVTAKPNADGSVTVHFGGDAGASNYLPITTGWSYVVRMYGPRKPVVDGTWKFPEAQPVRVSAASSMRSLGD